MENRKNKCSLKEHKEVDANTYCLKCNIYMCNKCDKYHFNIFPNHQLISMDKDISQIFTWFCKEVHHQDELYYYCKTHNVLCCAKCIAFKREGNGQHNGCDICNYEDIIEEKKQNLKKNIETFEELSKEIQSSIDELKTIVEKITNNKEDIKMNIQKVFTNLRNALNNREDELLKEVDNQFEKLFFNEEIFKKSEKLPNRIKLTLEKGKLIDKEWDQNNKLNSLVNDCINIENDIKSVNEINDKIKECNSKNSEIKFNSINEILFLESIKTFGSIDNKKEKKNIQNNININILDFNPQNIKSIKTISDAYGRHNYYICDNLCFFISKKNEYILAYIDNNSNKKSIIFYDINNEKEIKCINNAHEKEIFIIKYYDYNLYDIILTSSYNNDVKMWNYNQSLNILTINNIFENDQRVSSSALLFDTNAFYIFCICYSNNYIKVYNSSGNLYKTIGNNDESRYYIEIDEINDNKYILSGGQKGINVFNYPSFSNYYCFKEENDSKPHVYAKIIKINNTYNLIDVGNFNKIKIWDFLNKKLIKCIISNSNLGLGGFILINNIYLIIGCWDNEIKVFDINNGIIATKFNKHTSKVMGVKAIFDKEN